MVLKPYLAKTLTQEIFNCRVDEDVTEENCFKLIKKEDIIQDLKTRAAISDFHPVKKVVLEYPGEELLVVFDAKFQYGQNFYFVASEEAKENLLKPPETAEEKEEEENREETLEVHPYKPPVHKPWVSLGSEKEIEEESVKDTVTKIKYVISQVHRKFGAPITFTDKNASHIKDSYVECTSYEDKTFSIKMLEKDVGVQMVPKVREASTQTKWTYPKNAATQYFPRQLSNEEKEESLSSEKLKEFLRSVHLRMEIALQQNEIMNAFFDDWEALAEDESNSGSKPDVYLKAYQSFTDLRYLKDRTISCVCWHPTIYGIIAVSAKEQLSFEEQVNLSDKSLMQQPVIIFLSFSDPIHPQLMLECPEDIYCFQFCPSDPNIIAGGCINGQVLILCLRIELDISVFSYSIKIRVKRCSQHPYSTEPPLVRHCAVSSIQYSHIKPVTDIHWLPDYFKRTASDFETKLGNNIIQSFCSSVLFWGIPATKLPEQPSSEKVREKEIFYTPPDVPDTSKHLDLCWKPLIKVLYTNIEQKDQKPPLSNITIYLIFLSSQDGEIVYSNWKMEIDSDSAKPKYITHTETINVLQRSPFFNDIILSIGGRNFAIWKEGVTYGPILQSSCSAGRYTTGHWSLTRPGVFFIGRDDGNIDIWDLLKKSYEPSHFQNVSKSTITFTSPWIASPKHHFLAVSDDLGVLHVLEICQKLSHPSRNEVSKNLY
uniref:Dynein axonemal intermediate chain 3 n=1 Tax=Otus sunia TaxID=257818 RepID=A0A8C8B5M8_9STRI